ncbi:WhiB family transcriptional regulator [Streptomyces sp. NPDC015184]|uniref:WhiB family transcriptional regulator n=1 Tax=Streptomyces sp. NPDC015184 TaxID=3364946 RepID=UPI0036FD616D
MKYEWMDQALCAQVDPDLWFPGGAGSGSHKAKKVCEVCPVSAECGGYADLLEGDGSNGRRHGMWGGRSAQQRTKPRPRDAARDAAIVRLTDRGISPAEIAERLDISDRTVARVIAAHREQEVA